MFVIKVLDFSYQLPRCFHIYVFLYKSLIDNHVTGIFFIKIRFSFNSKSICSLRIHLKGFIVNNLLAIHHIVFPVVLLTKTYSLCPNLVVHV